MNNKYIAFGRNDGQPLNQNDLHCVNSGVLTLINSGIVSPTSHPHYGASGLTYLLPITQTPQETSQRLSPAAINTAFNGRVNSVVFGHNPNWPTPISQNGHLQMRIAQQGQGNSNFQGQR